MSKQCCMVRMNGVRCTERVEDDEEACDECCELLEEEINRQWTKRFGDIQRIARNN